MSSATEFPSHAGLAPTAMVFATAPVDLADQISAITSAALVERALHSTAPPFGYYRLTMRDGRRLFAKVLQPARLASVAAAGRVAIALAREGLPVCAPIDDAVQLDEGVFLLLHDWVDGRFFSGATEELAAIGGVVARLHEALPRQATPPRGAPDLTSLRDGAERLAAGRDGFPEIVASAAREALERWSLIDSSLSAQAQAVHNDLHAGNVMLDAQGRVSCVLDFEECLRESLNPLVDLSWILERWCLFGMARADAAGGAKSLLHAYRAARSIDVPRGALAAITLARCITALAALSKHRAPAPAPIQAEIAKFAAVLARRPDLVALCRPLED